MKDEPMWSEVVYFLKIHNDIWAACRLADRLLKVALRSSGLLTPLHSNLQNTTVLPIVSPLRTCNSTKETSQSVFLFHAGSHLFLKQRQLPKMLTGHDRALVKF